MPFPQNPQNKPKIKQPTKRQNNNKKIEAAKVAVLDVGAQDPCKLAVPALLVSVCLSLLLTCLSVIQYISSTLDF